MANICLYKIKVKGTKSACLALVNMMPLYSWEKEYISAEGTEENFTLVFSGACKWSVRAYTEKRKDLIPYTPKEIENVQDGDGWDICLEDKSFLLGCEIFCNSKDIDDYVRAYYEHYDKGKQIFDECPKELHIKRGRDYDQDFTPSEEPVVETVVKPACKVRFEDNRSYWYIGEYKIGDLVYVEGAKQAWLGIVKDISDTKNRAAIYNVVRHIGNIDLANLKEIETIWNSYKAKERKEYLKTLGLEESITKKAFISTIENKWIEFAQKENDWNKFLKTLR